MGCSPGNEHGSSAKPKSPNSNPKRSSSSKRLDAGVDMDLFSKTIISVVGDKHHRHPVISGVTRNLFRATAILQFS